MTHIARTVETRRDQALDRSKVLGWRVLDGGGRPVSRAADKVVLHAIRGEVLRPTDHVCQVVLDGSIPQHFASVRNFDALEPIVLDLARRQKLYFRQLVGLTRSEMLDPATCKRRRARFERVLESLGLTFQAA